MSVRVGDDIVAGSSGDVYTKTQVDALIAAAVAQTTEKPGMIKPFAGTTVPTGYLLCDGSAVSRATYANLFSAIGTTYGSGDGNSTFNLPDFVNGVPIHTNTEAWVGTTTKGRLPDIQTSQNTLLSTHQYTQFTNAWDASAQSSTHWSTGNSGYIVTTKFRASKYNSIYGDSNTTVVVPKGTFMRYIIKY